MRSWSHGRYPEAVALLVRVGFTCDHPWPALRVGEPVGHPRDDAAPLHPLALAGDLPLLLVAGFELAGRGRLREATLAPPDDPKRPVRRAGVLPSADAGH